jgi:hypothetical protein
MKTIYKYKAFLGGFSIDLPTGAVFVSAAVQEGCPVMWFIVDPGSPPTLVSFYGLMTGQEIPKEAGQYLATVTIQKGLVVHFFYLRPPV